MMSFLLPVLLFIASALGQDFKVYVGPGGCDVSDPTCVSANTTATQTIYMFSLTRQRDDPKPTHISTITSVSVGATPAWVQPAVSDHYSVAGCLFVTLTSLDRVGSFELDHNGAPHSLTSSGANDLQAPVHIHVSDSGSILFAAFYHGPDDTTNSTGAGICGCCCIDPGVGALCKSV